MGSSRGQHRSRSWAALGVCAGLMLFGGQSARAFSVSGLGNAAKGVAAGQAEALLYSQIESALTKVGVSDSRTFVEGMKSYKAGDRNTGIQKVGQSLQRSGVPVDRVPQLINSLDQFRPLADSIAGANNPYSQFVDFLKQNLSALTAQMSAAPAGSAAATATAGPTDEKYDRLYTEREKKDGEGSAAKVSGAGYIYVMTEPAGADVSFDGREHGRAPLVISSLKPGFHRINVRMGYYKEEEGWVLVADKQVSRIHISLKPGSGALTILSDQPESTILINGTTAGTAPATIRNLQPGVYSVAVQWQQFSWSGQVQVAVGDTTVVNAPLNVNRYAAAPAPAPVPSYAPVPMVPAPISPSPMAVPMAPVPQNPVAPAASYAPPSTPLNNLPPCKTLCGKYAGILMTTGQSQTVLKAVYDLCMSKCDAKDGRFLGCALQARNEQDVMRCNAGQ